MVSSLKGEHSIGDIAKSLIVDKIIQICDMEYILYIRSWVHLKPGSWPPGGSPSVHSTVLLPNNDS